ncbi:MAG: SpoVG family protein [Oscillospiraceae bacterium]|nr:SpoVG family protein [Oscillospiraceae bacterium]
MPAKEKEQKTKKPKEKINQALPINLHVRINSIVPGNGSKLRATASVGMNGCFAVRGVKIYEGPKGLFVTMPNYKSAKGEYRDYCHPVTKKFREQLNNAVLEAYRKTAVQQGQIPFTELPPASPMKIDVRITALTPGSVNQRASATVNLNDNFALKGIKIMEGQKGLFVHTPSYKSGEEYREHYFPTTKEFREQFHEAVLNAYDAAIVQSQESAAHEYSEEPAMAQSM